MQNLKNYYLEINSNRHYDLTYKTPPRLTALRGISQRQTGFFITLRDLEKAQFITDGLEIINYEYEGGNLEQGILFATCNLLAYPLTKTELLMKNDAVSQKSKKGVYFPYIKDWQEPDKKYSACRAYQVYLLDETKEILHQNPLVLILKGWSSLYFQNALKEGYGFFEKAMTEFLGTSFTQKNDEFHKTTILNLKCERKIPPESQYKTPVCAIKFMPKLQEDFNPLEMRYEARGEKILSKKIVNDHLQFYSKMEITEFNLFVNGEEINTIKAKLMGLLAEEQYQMLFGVKTATLEETEVETLEEKKIQFLPSSEFDLNEIPY